MINKGLFSSNFDAWTTPKDLFEELNNKYKFTIDLCASDENALLPRYYTKDNSCLNYTWVNEISFMNPPYGRVIKDFVKKAYNESLKGAKIVLLVPSRTDTNWFHNYIYNKPNIRIEFLKGRLKFGDAKVGAPFPSMLVYFNI